MTKEFRAVVPRGTIADLAIGVAIGVTLGTVIGSAFLRLVGAVISDVIFPIIGTLIPGGLDFSNAYIMLRGTAPEVASLAEARKLGTPLAIGDLASTAISFVILSIVVWFAMKFVIKISRVFYRPTSVDLPEDIELLKEIRDLLAKKC